MANHGAVTHGARRRRGRARTELLEWAATVYWNAHAIGTPRVLDDAISSRRSWTRRSPAATARSSRRSSAVVKAIAMGVHVLDVLVRPVEAIPEGQGGQLVDEIKMTAAGSAGGAALVLAKLGAEVRSAGAVGADPLAEMLSRAARARRRGHLAAVRRDDVQTSASVLPIRPDGSRPAFHVVGANAHYGPADVDWDAIAERLICTWAARSSWAARRPRRSSSARGSTASSTSADVLAPGDMGILEWIAPALPHLDYLLPNDEQAIGFTGDAGPRVRLRALVAEGSAASRRLAARTACCSSTRDTTEPVPAFEVRRRRHDRLWRRVLRRIPSRPRARA